MQLAVQSGTERPPLARRRALAKLLAFLGMAPLLLLRPVFDAGWLLAAAMILAGLGGHVENPWRMVSRFRFFFLALFLLHAFFTPGEVWPAAVGEIVPEWLPLPTRQGLINGGTQGLRLLLLILAALLLTRTTPPMALAGALAVLLGPLAWLGLPVGRFLALLAFALGQLPGMAQAAGHLRQAHLARGGEKRLLHRLGARGDALMGLLAGELIHKEAALRARGFGNVPLPPSTEERFSPWDLLLALSPLPGWML